MNAPAVYQISPPRKLSSLRGFRRDGTWRRQHGKTCAGIPQPFKGASLAHVMGWVLALITRRTAGTAWDDNQAAAAAELKERAWLGFDVEKRRTIRVPTWFHRKWIKARWWHFMALLVDAYREGAAGVLVSFAELASLVGKDRRTAVRWRWELAHAGLVTVVPTCCEATVKGRKRDSDRNLYMLGPRFFDLFSEAAMDGAGASEGARAAYRRDGASARRRATLERAEERKRYREAVRRYDDGPAAPAPCPAVASRPAVALDRQDPQPKCPIKGAPSKGGGDILPLQPPLRVGGSYAGHPTTDQPNNSLQSNATAGRDATAGQGAGAAGPVCSNAPSPAFANSTAQTAQWLENLRKSRPNVSDKRHLDGDRGPVRPLGQAQSAPTLATGDDWRAIAGQLKLSANPRNVCGTCEGTGATRGARGWDYGRPCRACQGSRKRQS